MRPSASICSSLSRASGLSIIVVSSKVDLDRALGRADARADHLALAAVDLPVAQIAHAAGAELADAGVADPLAAAERQLEAGLLAGHEDRRRAVALGLRAGGGERDRAALALLAAADLRLETLHEEALGVAVLLPMVDQRVEQVAGPGRERGPITPVRAQLVEVGGLHAAALRGEVDVQPQAVVTVAERAQLPAEDHVLLAAGRVEVD